MVRVVRLERTVSWSQTRRDTNFAIPGYSISAIIPRRGGKSKIFLSVVIHVVKAAFVPRLAIGGSPANAGVKRLCGVSLCPAPDTATALPNLAPYLSPANHPRIRIRRPHAGGVSTIPVFSPACKGKMSLRLTAPELPSAHPRGRSSPRPRPDPRAPCGRKPPACGRWVCADPAPE